MGIQKINQLQNVLENYGIKYKSHQEDFLTEPGENYGSIILKVEVVCENGEKVDLVAKLCPTNEVLKKAFLTDITFKKEIFFYSNIIPAIQVFEIQNDISETSEMFVNCFGARLNLNNNEEIDDDAILVLENLKNQGFQVKDRFLGYNFEESVAVIKNLAKMHSTIIAMRILERKSYEKNILPGLEKINSGSTMVEGFVGTALHFAKQIEEIKPYFGLLEDYLEKRKKLQGLEFPFESDKNFYTIVHTDLWSNNIMVKNGENCIQIKFLDFQLMELGSPIRDLLFFIFSSTQFDLIEKNFQKFLDIYYNEFDFNLLQFGCDLQNYSYKLFLKELNSVAPHELFHIIFMLKPIFSKKGSIDNLDNIKADDFGRIDNIGNEYLERLKLVILMYIENNWL